MLLLGFPERLAGSVGRESSAAGKQLNMHKEEGWPSSSDEKCTLTTQTVFVFGLGPYVLLITIPLVGQGQSLSGWSTDLGM